jgi:hypothetical protein
MSDDEHNLTLDLRVTPELKEYVEISQQGLLNEVTGILDDVSQQLEDLVDVVDRQKENIDSLEIRIANLEDTVNRMLIKENK